MTDARTRVERLAELFFKIEPVPATWLEGARPSANRQAYSDDVLPCSSWRELTTVARKALQWIPGLDRAFSVMLACCASTNAVGDAPLWVKVVGPPSSGKTTLAEAQATCAAHVICRDTLTSLTSGYQVDGSGSENLSLVQQMRGKTLIVKDCDTILQLPNRGQILSHFRALYDKALRTQYGNLMSTNHEDVNTTVIFCGTETMRVLDDSELGERFLDVSMGELDEDLEDEVGWRAVCQEARTIAMESNCQKDSKESPELVRFRRLTGGYVHWLRSNARRLLESLDKPEEQLRRCQTYAKFVSYARARPSKRQDESVQRELHYRLAKQVVRLACCLAVVLNRSSLDAEVMSRVRHVCLDTARGRTLVIMRVVQGAPHGANSQTIGSLCHEGDERLGPFLNFLRRVGVLEQFTPHDGLVAQRPRWRLTSTVRRLYAEVMRDADES
jgi:hypothetical protein